MAVEGTCRHAYCSAWVRVSSKRDGSYPPMLCPKHSFPTGISASVARGTAEVRKDPVLRQLVSKELAIIEKEIKAAAQQGKMSCDYERGHAVRATLDAHFESLGYWVEKKKMYHYEGLAYVKYILHWDDKPQGWLSRLLFGKTSPDPPGGWR